MAERNVYLPSLGTEVARAAGLDMSLVYEADLETPKIGFALLRVEMAVTQQCMEAAVAAAAARGAGGIVAARREPEPAPIFPDLSGEHAAFFRAWDSAAAPKPMARIAIDLLPGGRARIVSTCGGRPDASYMPLPDARLGSELDKLVAELRQQLAKG